MSRHHLPWIAVAATLALTITGCRTDDGVIVMKVAHNGPAEHPYQVGFETFKEVLERETDGAVRVEIFENAQLGTEEEASLMVKLGALAASAASAGGGLAAFVPEAEVFNFPFIFRDMDHFDVVMLGYWFSGERNTWNAERPVQVPADLKGLKIRVMQTPILIETFDSLGALATPMSFGELYSALEQGVVDGAETDHVDLFHERFYEVTRYVSYTRHLYLAVGLVFSRKLYDDLPAEIQQAVLKAGEASVRAEREAMARMTESAFAELQEKGILFNEVDRDAFQEKVQEVYSRNADRVGGLAVIEEVARQ
jgi:TRAP-type C4-dicarboxylate transport system substrate-binding protein